MEIGIHYIDFLPGDPAKLAPTLLSTATAAEDIGATMFTLADHFFQMEGVGRAEDPFLEGYTSLGYLAGGTTSITLTLMVTGVTYRYPGVLAKTVTTLDVLSQGRSMLGIGAAWYEREHLALGIPYPPVANGSRCSKRHCRSVCRCGATTTAPTTESTTSWPRPSANLNRFGGPRS